MGQKEKLRIHTQRVWNDTFRLYLVYNGDSFRDLKQHDGVFLTSIGD